MSPRRLQMSSRRPQKNPRRPERSPRRRKTSPRRPQGANLTFFFIFRITFSRVSKTRETYEAIRVLQGPATVGSYRSAPSSNRPASPRSGRARAEALVRASLSRFSGGSRHSRLAPLCGHGALLLQILLLSLLSPRLQCWTLSRLSRFPFHDSQVTGSARDASLARSVGCWSVSRLSNPDRSDL